MSYNHFFKIANISDNDERLKKYAHFYMNLKIDGLHYANFFASTNVISVCKPDHTTHHEGTSFLLECKSGHYSINTFRNYGNHLKKFLDFLMLWDMDILDGDLLVILAGFIDYLRLIESKGSANNPLPNKAIEWAILTYVPLHQVAQSLGKVSEITIDRYGNRKASDWGQIDSHYISKILSVVLRYLIFIRQRTNKYSSLHLGDLPVKEAYKENFLSGTLSSVKISMFNIKSILNLVGLKVTTSKKRFTPLKERIPTVSEMNYFFNSLPSNKRQNKFLFHILKCFGLRESEAANLQLDITTIPNNLIYLDNSSAVEILKKELRGDIEFRQDIDKWICTVVNRNSEDAHHQSLNKSIETRFIPLLFSEDEFSILLLDALKERYLIMRKVQSNHPYLFVSRAPTRIGERIRGRTVYDKLKNTLSKYIDKDPVLQDMTPHTFRHYFASYCLRILNESIDDVSRYLGHSDIEITRGTYSHLLYDSIKGPKDKVKDISDTFRAASIRR